MIKSVFDAAVCVEKCPKTKADGIKCNPQKMAADAKYKGMCTKVEKDIRPAASWMNICKVYTDGLSEGEKKNWVFIFTYILDHAPGGQ